MLFRGVKFFSDLNRISTSLDLTTTSLDLTTTSPDLTVIFRTITADRQFERSREQVPGQLNNFDTLTHYLTSPDLTVIVSCPFERSREQARRQLREAI
jgi:hypothetical protein